MTREGEVLVIALLYLLTLCQAGELWSRLVSLHWQSLAGEVGVWREVGAWSCFLSFQSHIAANSCFSDNHHFALVYQIPPLCLAQRRINDNYNLKGLGARQDQLLLDLVILETTMLSF